MDKFNIICFCLSFLPLVFGIYLLVSRFTLSCVNKKTLNYGICVINSLLFLFCSVLSVLIFKNNMAFEYELIDFNLNGTVYNLGFLISKDNLLFILISSFFLVLVSLYSKKYFDKKKHFYFTKQRYYCFLAIFSFLIYALLFSSNFLQMLFFGLLEGALIFIFSYFDVFKNSVNFNITRFLRIGLIGDFALICAILILYKYSMFLYEDSSYLSVDSINNTIYEMITNFNGFEVKLCFLLFLIAICAKLFIFPFNCYLSFLANSSDIFYICASNLSNFAFGGYLFFLMYPAFAEYSLNNYLILFFILSGIISIFLTIFEKNIKIIFGYLISGVNAFFSAGSLFFGRKIGLLIYVLAGFIITVIFMKIAYVGKINFKPVFFTKKTGFMIERAHIFVFEKMPQIIFKIFDFIDKYIVQNCILIFVKIIDKFANLFVLKIKTRSRINYIRAILLMLAFILLIAIFIALFGNGRYNVELIR